jgi:DNA adenine methylase
MAMARGTQKQLSLEPLIKWPGGKRHMAKRFVKMLPPHDTYVEPFAGGAALFFRKPLVKRNVIGDMDPWLVDLYKSTRNGGLRKCAGGVRKSRSLFKRVLKNQNGVCRKIALSALSWHGDRATYTGDQNTAGKILLRNRLRKHELYRKKLRKAYLRLGDFAATMRKFDGDKTVHFLDPPWLLEYSDSFYHGGTKARIKKHRGMKKKGTAFDPEHLKKVCDGMKGYVFIIINNHPRLRKIFCNKKGWKCRYIVAKVNKGGKNVRERQLVITKRFGKINRKR